MKYLCIDYGSKKCGFANSDDEGRIAFPLMISPTDQYLLKDTLELIRSMNIGTLVIGESVDGQGKPNEIAKKAREFALKIENEVDVNIAFEKEWFSTTEARKVPGHEGSHEVDDKAATIILQRYLDKINGPGEYVEQEVSDDDGDEQW